MVLAKAEALSSNNKQKPVLECFIGQQTLPTAQMDTDTLYSVAEGRGDCPNTLVLQVYISLRQHKVFCWNSYCLSLVLPLSFLCSLERIPIPKAEIKKQRSEKA